MKNLEDSQDSTEKQELKEALDGNSPGTVKQSIIEEVGEAPEEPVAFKAPKKKLPFHDLRQEKK